MPTTLKLPSWDPEPYDKVPVIFFPPEKTPHLQMCRVLRNSWFVPLPGLLAAASVLSVRHLLRRYTSNSAYSFFQSRPEKKYLKLDPGHAFVICLGTASSEHNISGEMQMKVDLDEITGRHRV